MSANGTFSSSLTGDKMWSTLITYIFGALYVLSSFVGLVANSLVVYLILRTPTLKRTTNYLLMSIALVDLGFLGLVVPFTVLANLVWRHWVFGSFLCSTISYVQVAIIIQRSLLLCASAILQHRVFRHPFKRRVSTKTVGVLIPVVWMFALSMAAPSGVFAGFGRSNPELNATTFLCVEHWPEPAYQMAYTGSLLVITYVFPVLVLFITKIDIAIIMFSRSPPIISHERSLQKRMEKRKKVSASFVR